MRGVPDEVLYFGRSAVFGLVVAAVYWFASYELAGTVLLGFFGLAGAVATAILLSGSRAWSRAARPVDDLQPDGPFGDESGRIPAPTLAPLFVGLGLAIALISLAFGVWFVMLGAIILVPGAVSWLTSAEREMVATEAESGAAAEAETGAEEAAPSRTATRPDLASNGDASPLEPPVPSSG